MEHVFCIHIMTLSLLAISVNIHNHQKFYVHCFSGLSGFLIIFFHIELHAIACCIESGLFYLFSCFLHFSFLIFIEVRVLYQPQLFSSYSCHFVLNSRLSVEWHFSSILFNDLILCRVFVYVLHQFW